MKRCKVCKTTISGHANRKFCSLKCQHESWAKPCAQCGTRFAPSEARVIFCSRSCGAKWKMSQPEIVAKMIAGKDLEAAGKAISAGIRANKKEMARRKAFGREYGGKSGGWQRYHTGMKTSAESILLAIYPKAIHNFKVATGESSKLGKVHYYKIDLAWPDVKVGVEVDGSYHRLPGQKEKDERKDLFLQNNGWTILRFANKAVIRNIGIVQMTIEGILSPLNKA